MIKRQRPILRYHGGKWILAPWIISHFPKHRIYCEPFGGGGSVLLRKEPAYAEVYNDLWDCVVNVFRVMRDPDLARRLERSLRLTPYSRTEFLATQTQEANPDPVEWARQTIFRSFAGFGSAATNGKYATGFRANSNRSGTTPAHDWRNYPDHLARFTERLKGVVIENKDYREIISQQDSPETLFYLDPPYVHETRNMKRGNAAYAFEMTTADHEAMAEHLYGIKGMAAVSGYDCDLYRQLFKDWQVFRRKAYADGAAERTEVLWLNPACAEALINELIY